MKGGHQAPGTPTTALLILGTPDTTLLPANATLLTPGIPNRTLLIPDTPNTHTNTHYVLDTPNTTLMTPGISDVILLTLDTPHTHTNQHTSDTPSSSHLIPNTPNTALLISNTTLLTPDTLNTSLFTRFHIQFLTHSFQTQNKTTLHSHPQLIPAHITDTRDPLTHTSCPFTGQYDPRSVLACLSCRARNKNTLAFPSHANTMLAAPWPVFRFS